MKAFIVLQRRGSLWVLPRQLRSRGPARSEHVPFVYVSPDDVESGSASGDYVRAAIRKAYGYAPDNGSRFMVFDVEQGTVVVATQPPRPDVELEFSPPDTEDMREGTAEMTRG